METKRGKRERVQGRGALEIFFSISARCSRRGFLCVFGMFVNAGRGVMFLLALQCLPRFVFTYFRSEKLWLRLSAFRSTLFCLAVSYAN